MRVLVTLVSLALIVHSVRSARNIAFVFVDELRVPSVFPAGINSADEFLVRYMPNLYWLWQRGVKFGSHYAASQLCTPSRSSIVTGLYTHQTFEMLTRAGAVFAPEPELSNAFPTYGKLLQSLGYDTPYAGKWHLSNSPACHECPGGSTWLNDYGFQGLTVPDPIGYPGQGVGAHGEVSDIEIADDALKWLENNRTSQPFFLTVGFVNPHDIQYYWGVTEYDKLVAVYKSINESLPIPPIIWQGDVPTEDDPIPQGFPAVPPNFETDATLLANKPKAQTIFNEYAVYKAGAISYTEAQNTSFTAVPSQSSPGKHKAVAPYYYWARWNDLYANLMSDVDAQLGRVFSYFNSTPGLEDTIIIFSSDHGDYGGSHGLRGKGFTLYDESIRVPLVVYDPLGEFTGDESIVRTQLTSHVDLLSLFLTLASNGSTTWLNESDNRALYGNRFNMLPLLKSSTADGRKYVLHATDEYIHPQANFLNASQHILGVVTPNGKFGLYSNWPPGTFAPIPDAAQEAEYYDYTVANGHLEINNTPFSAAANSTRSLLMNALLLGELEAALPSSYHKTQLEALLGYWATILID